MEKKDYSSTDSNYPEIVASDIIANIYNEDYKRYVSDEEAISLYDLLGFMDLDRANTLYNIHNLLEECNDILSYHRIRISSPVFDSQSRELVLNYKDKIFNYSNKIHFGLENDETFIKSKVTSFAVKTLNRVSHLLPKLYKWCEYDSSRKTVMGNNSYMNPLNSNYIVNIFGDHIKLAGCTLIDGEPKLYYISYFASNDRCRIEILNDEISSFVLSESDEILKRIYISIEQCPYRLKDLVREFRKQQLSGTDNEEVMCLKNSMKN